MSSHIEEKAKFDFIRYAQVWEDADVLLEALRPLSGGRFVSVCSAGDNALSLLTLNPQEVVALDLSEVQTFCLDFRIAALKTLPYEQVLEIIGSVPSQRRIGLYTRLRKALAPRSRQFWDLQEHILRNGVGSGGKFERYFALFRSYILPFLLSGYDIRQLLTPKNHSGREVFYETRFMNWRFKALMRFFFSRTMMGRLGRDPEFFAFAEGSLSDNVMKRTRHALVELDPSENPYLSWILRGKHDKILPFWLRPENFEAIRDNLDRLRYEVCSLETFVQKEAGLWDGFNLSDVFEYMPEATSDRLLSDLAQHTRPGGRLVYWNMMVPRDGKNLPELLRPLPELSEQLHAQDRAFFYSRLVVEERV
ncbi:DUF3419 family protein [Deinococcus roseus]|uniref:S-adenosylmethionine--diacylglycerol 3-amino-3-carboxypropyl transferase n=1 Tax=Deinococcus roseus TaxID=392414 RepID=A0ABQ2D1K6_9DEIO|nr:DUF3419 family protein [Deinococcus roseus]GGJ41827.1 S-adenosylmethionine--diacylglycerol 3-amino-3-carboxypropyl transferase [Deinococcus roseus]